MKINVHIQSGYMPDVALQIFDFYFAYSQYQNKHNNYKSTVDIRIGDNLEIEKNAINIGWFYMPTSQKDFDKFDIIMVDSGQHHLEVCTETMYEAIKLLDNCYFVCGAYIDTDYLYYPKMIYCPNYIMTKDFFSRPFYPQYYEPYSLDVSRKNLICINGQDRPHRRYMANLIKHTCGSLVDIRENHYKRSTKLLDSFFESIDDTNFRLFVNSYVPIIDNVHELEQAYYDQGITVGIDQKFGKVPPGYFMLDEFLTYNCVIWPDTTWLNDEIFFTEKMFKCALAKTVPWPIAGSNTDVLYNKLGFQTAWNLLPKQLQLYNYEKNHIKRYQMCADAIAWLANRPEILTGPEAQHIVDNNFNLIHSCKIDGIGMPKLDNILKKYKNKC